MKNIEFRLYEKPVNIQIVGTVYDASTLLSTRLQKKLFKSIETRILGWTILGLYDNSLKQLEIKYSLCSKFDNYIKKRGVEEATKNVSYVVIPIKFDASIKDIRAEFIYAAESLIRVLEKKAKLRI